MLDGAAIASEASVFRRVFAPRFASDSCSDVERPHICCAAAGLWFRFPLEGEWRERHITLTEACGNILCLMVFPHYFPDLEYMVEGDASSGMATMLAAAGALALAAARREAEKEEAFRKAARRAWCTHCKGWANGITDKGSRDKLEEMFAIAAAYGYRMREVPIPAFAVAFMRRVLEATRPAQLMPTAHDTTPGTENLNMIGDMPVAEASIHVLLDRLGAALAVDGAAQDVARHANAIIDQLGDAATSSRRPAAQRAIAAAYYLIRQPRRYQSQQDAWQANGASRRATQEWKRRIEQAIAAAPRCSISVSSAPSVPVASSAGGAQCAAMGAQSAEQAAWAAIEARYDAAGALLEMGQTGARGSTSRGGHNPNMDGNEPRAHDYDDGWPHAAEATCFGSADGDQRDGCLNQSGEGKIDGQDQKGGED